MENIQRYHENEISECDEEEFEILAMSLNFEDLKLGGTDGNLFDELILFRDAVFTGRTLPFLFSVASKPSFHIDSWMSIVDQGTDEDSGDAWLY